jgi:hypothetical protein
MNFFFMLIIIFIILIFIKLNIYTIPNYLFLILLLILLSISEIYNYKDKEKYTSYKYDSSYDRYYDSPNYVHTSSDLSNKLGLNCSISKSLSKKKIQDNRFKSYNNIKNNMNNVIYGDKQVDEIQFPDKFSDVDKYIESDLIKQVNIDKIQCPLACNLLDTETSECENAIYLKEVLQNEDNFNTTKPIFRDSYTMRMANDCLKITSPATDWACGDNCKYNDNLNKCVYNKKKCQKINSDFEDGIYPSKKKDLCVKRCELFNEQSKCPTTHCEWNNYSCVSKL